ncbi:putative cyclin-dependent serine/threonine-protein kinase DDB_G0272797/DDB_G0274007 [Manduca sexta]|uniref:putative cyclin-dependent serine/threonine-protein kinase DDB_G0272797/DDB_G0274007 n=1 Tax=Manduca sexta TaxID=7130 RepID=UPI00188FF1A4|nr:putative cyclin-dependent serine/threonine-protein kinase DDB_G0272797/DDB_G0274007 [Manduca sexta]
MQITVFVPMLVALSYAADAKSKEKNAASKTDKRDLLEGNYGDRTYLKNVLRTIQGIDYSHQEDALAARSPHVVSSEPRIAKISDLLSGEGPHYSAISDHLFSPVSAYQSRLSSPAFDLNSELGLSDLEPKHKPSKKHKKPKSPPKRTYPSYEPRALQFDTLSSFANYQPGLSQFKNPYQGPTFDRELFSPRIFAEPSIFRPNRPVAPQYYPQVYQQPQLFSQQGIPSQREYQPVQYIQQPAQQVLPNVAYSQRAQQVIPGLQYSQGAPQTVPGFTYPQAQQVVSSPAFAQPTQQAPGLIYTQEAQQSIPAYNQNPPQFIPGVPYAQGAQQAIPSLAYTQGPQQPGVIYAQQPEANIVQQQPISVAQQQPVPQEHLQPQQVQGAVSYASFSQSLPPYAQPQPQPQPHPQPQPQLQLQPQPQPQPHVQQVQAPQPIYTQSQTLLLPARPDLQQPVQQQYPVPDSQPQPQQISESHPTSQPDEERVVTILPAKKVANDHKTQTESLKTASSNVESTTQPAPQEIAHPEPTQAPPVLTTLPNLVPSTYQRLLQDFRPQQAENGPTYLQQGPHAYPQGVQYQQPGLVNGGVTPAPPSVQYFGNFAESLFRNYP